ncbi:MAG: outer membrane protein transport protein [Rhodobiaceae bacterium]|nr:outer membrane protein transport protein [Rhodobiaceae bacterium]
MAGAVAAAAVSGTPASATDGYFQIGFGARQSALGGAGVADSRDAMAQSLNPAGIAGLPEQIQVGIGLFMPFRGYDATGPGFVAPGGASGSVDSDANIFGIPNLAYVRPLTERATIGVSLYGNGGMNTTYGNEVNTACGGGVGVYCGGKAGVDLMQAFLSLDLAYDFGPVKVGIAPTLAVQRFKARGLVAFSAISADPTNLTNNGYSYSFGGGLRGGIEWEVVPRLRIGLSGQTPMWMSKFDEYSGLFADKGSFDIPAAVTVGVAFDVLPELTLMADYEHIFYSSIDSIANSSTAPALLGSKSGPGFGWDDVDVIKVGAEWRPNDKWTLRAGYAYATNPVNSSDVTFNILAPGIVQHHITAGGSYRITEKDTLELAGVFVPESTVSGIEVTPLGPNPGRRIELNMHQFQLNVGWTHEF